MNHDDWVAGVACCGDYVLSACYDNTVSIWNKVTGAKLLTSPGHAGPARAVAWVSLDQETGIFASTSHDQTVLLHQWNIKDNSIDCVNACKGHERSVDCVTVDPTQTLLASGSFDNNLKIWGASLQMRSEAASGDDQVWSQKQFHFVEITIIEAAVYKSRYDHTQSTPYRPPHENIVLSDDGIQIYNYFNY